MDHRIEMPLPPGGPLEFVPGGAPTAFNWEYRDDREHLATTSLNDGDRVEFLFYMGGGR